MKAFSELTARQKGVELLRWLAVLPAAVLGCFAPRYVLSFLFRPLAAQLPGATNVPTEGIGRWIVAEVASVLVGAAFVVVGTLVAPRFRSSTAIGLAVLWIGFSLQVHLIVPAMRGGANYVDFAVVSFGALCGAAWFVYAEKSKGRGTAEL